MNRAFAYHADILRRWWPWLPLWATLALLAIFSHGPTPLYSTRTLSVAWEMWNGGHWLVPYLNGAPYSHKVPLLFWMIHAGWALFGVSDVWPRVLEVVFGGVQLVLAATLARRLFPARPWVATATPWMLLALCYAFLFGLQVMYEVLLAVWVLAALLCLVPKAGRAAPRFALFGLCIGLGLLSKGPVMLLHVLLPWLLGPLWSDWSRNHRGRWYGFGSLALLGGVALFALWLVPALKMGGEVYAHTLLFKQTTGRMVDAFDHARPLLWYLPWLLVLLFPFVGWPRVWVALLTLRRPLESGVRMLICWFLPVLAGFSLISSKQAYYLLPEFAAAVMLMAAALDRLGEQRPQLSRSGWLRPWPLAFGAAAFGAFLLVLPMLTGSAAFDSHWFIDLARYSAYFGAIFVVLGVLVLLPGRGTWRRIAVAGVVGAFSAHALFTLTLWHNYDLDPSAQLLATAAKRGHDIAIIGAYAGQYQFASRLQQPIERIQDYQVADWARQHPHGVVLTDRGQLTKNDLRYALLVHPFRSGWVVIWSAPTLATLYAGAMPAPRTSPTALYPQDYWRYQQFQ